MNMKTVKLALVAATLSALPLCSIADGGWLNRKWDPASTNSIPRLAMPTAVCSAGSAINGTATQRAAKSPKASATRTLLGASGSVSFSPSGLSGRLPTADDSRIQELARGLDHNWERCFDFVRNHIFHTPYPGIMKGPELTLLDREGNAADQSFLLCALLRASGYSSATVLYAPLKVTSSFDSGFIFPLYNFDGNSPYNAVTWLAANSDYAISRKLGSNGLGLCWMGDDHLGIEHYWVRVEINGEAVDLDPSIKPQPTPSAKNAKTASGYARDAFLAAAGGTVDANSAKNLSESGIAAYLKARIAELKEAWNIPGASPSTILGSPTITPRAPDEPRFHGVWSSRSEPIDLLAASSADILDSLRTKVTLDNYGYDFMTFPNEPDWTTEFSFYLDEVGSRTLWFAKDENDDLGFYVDEEKVSQSALWDYFGAAAVGVNVACTNHPTYHSYMMFPEDGQVHVLSVNLGGDNPDGIRKVATKRISKLRDAGLSDTDNVLRAAILQLQGQQWLAQVEKHSRVWSRVIGGDKSHYYNIGIAGQSKGPFVDMANSYGRGYGGSGLVESHMMFSSALEHSVIEQLNGAEKSAVSTVKILSLANASGNPIYFANSNNVSLVMSSLSGYSTSQKNSFTSAAQNGEIYLLPKNATVTLNRWTGTGYIEYGEADDGSNHTGMIISGGMNGGYCSIEWDPESQQYVMNCYRTTDHQRGDVDSSTQADPVVMPAGAYIDNEVDLAVARAVPLVWSRSYDTRSAATDGDLGRGWSHGFEAYIVETTDADAALGEASIDAVLPAVVATVAAEDMMSETDGLSAGEIARRWTAAALVANWWTEQLPQTCVAVKIGAKTLSFQMMPDGSFAPAPGVTATLSRDVVGCYTLQERHGNTYRFNWLNRLEEIEDSSGNKTVLDYDISIDWATGSTNALLTKVENSFGATMTIARDSAGRIASVTDNSGKRVSYSYDSNGCMTSATDAAGEVWPYAYDSVFYRMVWKKNPNGDYLIRNTYNDNGQVTNQISSNGQPWRFGYAANAEAWNEDPKGGRLTEVFDLNGRVVSRTRRDGANSKTTYDGHGNVTVATDALEHRKTFTYDANDNLLSTTEGTGSLTQKNSFVYDAQDRLIATTNALGYITTYEYDVCHRLTRKTMPDGTYKTNVWNPNGTLAESRFNDASGNVMRRIVISYGSYWLPVSRTIKGIGLPNVGITTYTEYNEDGSIAATVDALGHRTIFDYNAAGRLISTTDALGHTDTIGYNKSGQIVSERDALGRVKRTTRTVSGLPLETIFADGSVNSIVYDNIEDVIATVDVRGARRTIERDAEGRPIATQDALGNISQMSYDILGRPIWKRDASGIQRWTAYDSLSRPISTVNAIGAIWGVNYDKLNRAISATTPFNKTLLTTYDKVGQIVALTHTSGAVDYFGYDAMGNQTSYTNTEKHVYSTSFDALGRAVASTNALGVQVAAITYDSNGNVTCAIDGNGAVCAYAYDALDRIVSRTTADDTTTFSYDSVGNILSAINSVATESFEYDVVNQLVAATTVTFGLAIRNEWKRDVGGLVTNLVYATNKTVTKKYDIEGRLTSVSDWLGHTWSFVWDGAGRLISISSPDGRTRVQTYDAVGRLASWNVGDLIGRTLEYDLTDRKICENVTAGSMPIPQEERSANNVFDAADRLVSSTVRLGNGMTRTETFSYDGNDAMIRAVSSGETVTFRYDADGALAGFTPNGNETVFEYDALGNRILVGEHVWIPDQNDSLKRPLLEYDGNGDFVRAYIWIGGVLLGYIDANNVLTVAHVDEMGGVVALSQTNGTVLHTAQYGPHGENWGKNGTNPTPFAWLGGFGVQRLSSETFIGDIYLTRYRLYAPTHQRFLSSDPMGLSGGFNLYAYGNGNPVSYIDPLGLCAGKKSWWDKAKEWGNGAKEYLKQSWEVAQGYGDAWADDILILYNYTFGDPEIANMIIAEKVDYYKSLPEKVQNGTLTNREAGYGTGDVLALIGGGMLLAPEGGAAAGGASAGGAGAGATAGAEKAATNIAGRQVTKKVTENVAKNTIKGGAKETAKNVEKKVVEETVKTQKPNLLNSTKTNRGKWNGGDWEIKRSNNNPFDGRSVEQQIKDVQRQIDNINKNLPKNNNTIDFNA